MESKDKFREDFSKKHCSIALSMTLKELVSKYNVSSKNVNKYCSYILGEDSYNLYRNRLVEQFLKENLNVLPITKIAKKVSFKVPTLIQKFLYGNLINCVVPYEKFIFTSDQINIKHFQVNSDDYMLRLDLNEAAELLGMSRSTLSIFCNRLGFSYSKRRQQLTGAYIKKNINKLPLTKISAITGLSYSTILRRVTVKFLCKFY